MTSTQLTAKPATAAEQSRFPFQPSFRLVLGTRVDSTHYAEAVEAIVGMSQTGASNMVCVATVHSVMEAVDDAGFRSILNSAELVTSDGVPLVWCLRLLGLPRAERVYGPILMPRVCERAAALGIPVGLYGGSERVLAQLQAELGRRFPNLQVVYAHSPPFRPPNDAEDAAVGAAIRDSGCQILFVGLGCPKQERWMAAHREALGCTMLGVGAAFDFLAGAKLQAPARLQAVGLEWLFRLCCEPRRLWHRYLTKNPRFLLAFARQWLRQAPLGRNGAQSSTGDARGR